MNTLRFIAILLLSLALVLLLFAWSAGRRVDATAVETLDVTGALTPVHGQLAVVYDDGLEFQSEADGSLSLFVNRKDIDFSQYAQVEMAIKDRPPQLEAELLWQDVRGETHVLPVGRSVSGRSITPLNPDWLDWTEVRQLGVRFVLQPQIGWMPEEPFKLYIRHLRLRSQHFFDPLRRLWSELTAFQPLEIQSINHLGNQSGRFLYSPVALVACWIALSLLILRVFAHSRAEMLTCVFIGWLVLVLFQTKLNLARWQHHPDAQATGAAAGVINNLDALALRTSNQVKQFLQHGQNQVSGAVRLLVFSSDDFLRTRLMYHLLPMNVAKFDAQRGTLVNQIQADQLYLLVLESGPEGDVCLSAPVDPAQGTLTRVVSERNYCLMRLQ